MIQCIRRASTLLVAAALMASGRGAAAQTADSLMEATCCRSAYPVAALGRYRTSLLGQEYQRLKRTKCAACARYGSDLQRVMETLGTRLNGKPRAAIVRVLGPPDEVAGRQLIYHWRYRHDYLYFTLDARGRATSAWYYALE